MENPSCCFYSLWSLPSPFDYMLFTAVNISLFISGMYPGHCWEQVLTTENNRSVINQNFISFHILQSKANIREFWSSFFPRMWQRGTGYLDIKSQNLTRCYMKVNLTLYSANGKTSDYVIPDRAVVFNQKASLWQKTYSYQGPSEIFKTLMNITRE